MSRPVILLLLVLASAGGCSPAEEPPGAQIAGPSWQTGDNTEAWSRCGPIAGAGKDCLALARRYADGTQSNRSACIAGIGGPDDEQLNNAWLTLGSNGADPAALETWRARRLARFRSALAAANDPGSAIKPVQRQFFRDDFTDCWDTYSTLRGLQSSSRARDDFITMMEPFH